LPYAANDTTAGVFAESSGQTEPAYRVRRPSNQRISGFFSVRILRSVALVLVAAAVSSNGNTSVHVTLTIDTADKLTTKQR
jgi:hypothetical protein